MAAKRKKVAPVRDLNLEWEKRTLDSVAFTYRRFPIAMVRGKGAWVWDANGKKYLDFLAGVAVNCLGHAHPVVTKAIREQAGRLVQISNYFHIPSQTELAEEIEKRSFTGRVFFCNSGTEANEGAIKLARKWGMEHGGRYEIVSTSNSFHGRTVGSLSMTGQTKYAEGFGPLLPGIRFVPFNNAAALAEAVTEKTCAVALEPVQGEGGVVVPGRDYLKRVKEICRGKGALLIVDEIQAGMGRTGTLFSYEQMGYEPDIMTLAKGLGGGVPIGAICARKEVMETLGPGTHGSTFGGNPLATATALAVIREVSKPSLLANVRKQGDRIRSFFRKLQAGAGAGLISDIRGMGLLIGIEVTREGPEIVKRALELGLIANCTAGNVIRLVPPLNITSKEADTACRILQKAMGL